MSSISNLNKDPYFSDFDSLKNFYQVLFKSGYALQARELNNLQQILQDQVSQFGRKLMVPGDTVIPGEFNFVNPVSYVKIQQITNGAKPEDYINSTLKGVTSGVKAVVEYIADRTETDSIVFYVKYVDSGVSKINKIFTEGEVLESDTQNKLTAVVGVSNQIKPVNSPAIGYGCIFDVKAGSYFVNGFMVRNYAQTLIVDKYSTSPTCKIGFLVRESFITSNEDESLLDNSQGYPNFAAPGADRLKIDLTLLKLDEGIQSPENFIQLVSIVQGNIQGSQTQDVKWKWLFDILANRTFNESGDYVVNDFTIQPLEYVNTNDIDGLYNPDTDGLFPPVEDDESPKITLDDARSYYVLNMGPGLAYVQGYEVGFDASLYIPGEKARDTNIIPESSIIIDAGSYFNISSVFGAPDIQNVNTVISSSVALTDIVVSNMFTDGFVGQALKKITSTNSSNVTISRLVPYNLGYPAQFNYHIVCIDSLENLNTSSLGDSLVYLRGNSIVVKSNQNAPISFRRGDSIIGKEILYSFKIPPLPSGVLRPLYFDLSNPIIGNENHYNYNSEFKLGAGVVKYFTHLNVFGQNFWSVGDFIIGSNSKATAVIENGCIYDVDSDGHHILVVSNIIGEFLPGEQIVQGGRSAFIAKEGEISALVMTGSAGSFGSEADYLAVESIVVTSLNVNLTITKSNQHFTYNTNRRCFQLTSIGRDFIFSKFSQLFIGVDKRVNYNILVGDKVTNPDKSIGIKGFATSLTPIVKQNAQTIKSFYSSLFDYNDFSADISTQNRSSLDNFIVAGGANFSGIAGNNYVICGGFVGNAALDLDRGDIITIVDVTGDEESYVVLFATTPSGVGANITPSYIYFTTTLKNNVASAQIIRVRTRRQGENLKTLIYELPQKLIKTIKPTDTETKINYQIFAEFVTTFRPNTTSANTITLTSGRPNEKFVGDLSHTSIVVIRNRGSQAQTAYYEGLFLNPLSVELSENDTKMVLTVNCDATNLDMKIITPIDVSNGVPKLKTLITYTNILTETATVKRPIKILGVDASRNIISLKRTDVIEINKIEIVAGLTTLDVTNNYILDNGQRNNYYDISRLQLKAGFPVANSLDPTWYLNVYCTAFDHGIEGDFFSVDSYTHSLGINFENIPDYISTTSTTKEQQRVISLRDSVDFRPSVNTLSKLVNGNETQRPSRIPLVDPSVDEQDAINFISTAFISNTVNISGNASVGRFMIPGTKFKCNVEYYMGRIDTVFLHSTGKMSITKGISGLNPVAPNDFSSAIRLYDLVLPPYTFKATDIYIKKYNYRRYTMKDISSIDNRLNRVEDYVTLSLLEQSALNTQVRDAVTGLDRYKNGFITDTFKDHLNGDTLNSEYMCSIDPQMTCLRPPFISNQVTLEEINQIDYQRFSQGYQKTGQLLTLPYNNVEFIKNEFATRTENIQPFSVFIYKGEITLNPSLDTWTETKVRPRVVIEDNSLYDSMVNMTDSMSSLGIGTVWGDWSNTSESSEGVIQSRTQTKSTIGVNSSTSKRVETAQGNRVVDIQISRTMRSIPVLLKATRLKPNTEFYATFDNIDVSRWISCDVPTLLDDGTTRYLDNSNKTSLGFGSKILSDSVGNITGLFLIPQGYAPKVGQIYAGDLTKIEYDDTSTTRNFDSGVKDFKLIDMSSRIFSNTTVDSKSIASAVFTSSGVIQDKEETIISTRQPQFTQNTIISDVQSRIINPPPPPIINNITNVTNVTNVTNTVLNVNQIINPPSTPSRPSPIVPSPPPPPPSLIVPPRSNSSASAAPVKQDARQSILQMIRSNFRTTMKPGGGDPIAQTFEVDQNNSSGVFVTELNLYFSEKDEKEGVMIYLTPTDGGRPTDTVIPFSISNKESDSILRVQCNLGPNVTTETLLAGVKVVGSISGAVGIIKNEIKFNSPTVSAAKNVTNIVYDVILSNYLKGDFISGETIIPQTSPLLSSTFNIVQDEFVVSRVDVRNLGQDYTGDLYVDWSSPDLPGGQKPTTKVISIDGKVYRVELITSGNGYIHIPTATIKSNSPTNIGIGCILNVKVDVNRKGVEMGVATSIDATAPTKFKFESPVYLMGNTTYAFVVKSPNSIKYELFISRLGENRLGTNNRVVAQPLLGSIFRSQNSSLWTENQAEDVMFTLNRADFVRNVVGTISLENTPLDMEFMLTDPIETYKSQSYYPPDNGIFGEDPKVIKIHKGAHGLAPGDYVLIEGIVANGVGGSDLLNGIPLPQLNNIHKVLSVSFDQFTAKVNINSVNSGKGGGSWGKCSANKPFEVLNLVTGSLNFNDTNMSLSIETTSAKTMLNENQQTDVDGLSFIPYILSNPNNIVNEKDYFFTKPNQCASFINEAIFTGDSNLRGKRSLNAYLYLSTNDSRVSPVFDYDRTNAKLIHNLINYPQGNDFYGSEFVTVALNSPLNYNKKDRICVLSKEKLYDVSILNSDLSTNSLKLSGNGIYHLRDGLLETISKENNQFIIDINNISTINRSNLVKETAPVGGSTFSKWISKEFRLENGSDGLDVRMSAITYEKTSIRVYYKLRRDGFDGNLSDLNWVPFNNDGLSNNNDTIKIRSSNIIDPAQLTASDIVEYSWTAQNLPNFYAFSLKIVMTAINPAKCPLIMDLRAIASE